MNIPAQPVIEFIKSKNTVSLTESMPQEESCQQPEAIQSAPKLPVIDEPDSGLAESIRAVRTQLILNGFPSSKKRMALISVSHDCGANHFSANLAVLFSQLGKQTLLIDTNLKYPVLHQVFNLPETNGLSDILIGHTPVNKAFVSFRTLPDLTLLPAGKIQSNASELISKPEFKTINEQLAREFDIILYDAPPFFESTDALIIANYVDYVLLLIHKHHVRLADVSNACKQIIDGGGEIIGSILVDY
ncbi:MAG: CpsD/CapB family tyrosine-protein kinase [Nitrosomonas sp.]|nr:CpsD/CapB family tyrosine-protein kinase [Nitrosomonas sp.]